MSIDYDTLQPVHLLVQSQAAAAGRVAAADFLSSPSVDQEVLRSKLYAGDPDTEDSLPYCDNSSVEVSGLAAEGLKSYGLSLDELEEQDRQGLLADLKDGYSASFDEAMFGQIREDLGLIYS